MAFQAWGRWGGVGGGGGGGVGGLAGLEGLGLGGSGRLWWALAALEGSESLCRPLLRGAGSMILLDQGLLHELLVMKRLQFLFILALRV